MPEPAIRAHQASVNDEEGLYYNVSSTYEGIRNYYGPTIRFSVPDGNFRLREDIGLKLMEQYLTAVGYVVLSPATLLALRNMTGQDIG